MQPVINDLACPCWQRFLKAVELKLVNWSRDEKRYDDFMMERQC